MKKHFKISFIIYKYLLLLGNITLILIGIYFSEVIAQELTADFWIESLGISCLFYFAGIFIASLYYWFGAVILIILIHLYYKFHLDSISIFN